MVYELSGEIALKNNHYYYGMFSRSSSVVIANYIRICIVEIFASHRFVVVSLFCLFSLFCNQHHTK